MAHQAPKPTIAIVVKGYPRLSETFIAQEILGLQEHGFELRIVSLRHPTDKNRHPVHEKITAAVTYLPEYLYQEPMRVLKGWAQSRQLSGYAKAFSIWVKDLWRDLTPNRVRRFGQACVLAAELGEEVDHLYAHFLHTPASVARYAALMRGLPWSVSAHAKDIWTSPEWEKQEKLADADWAVTCTAVGHEHLSSLAPERDRVTLLYHGLDHSGFPEPPRREEEETRPFTIVSVGRAVEKKGYDDLLNALAKLPQSLDWRFVHVGGGKLTDTLKQQSERLGIGDKIDWRGSGPRQVVIDALQEGDLFVLASKIADDGDRDGLPNVLMEAQLLKVPVLSTNVSAIPELILEGETGVLVPPGDPEVLSQAIASLAENKEKRLGMAEAGHVRVLTHFDHGTGIQQLANLLLGRRDSEESASGRGA